MNFKVISIFIGFSILVARADYQDDTWQEPNAWERYSPDEAASNSCPACSITDDGPIAAFYYKKLITHLFNKNALKENKINGRFERGIVFSISADQLVSLEEIKDIRDTDSVVTAILASARVVPEFEDTDYEREHANVRWLIFDIVKDSVQLLKVILANPEARFALLAVGVLMLFWFIHKHYNKNLIFVISVGLLLFGYFYTYIECNRKLEADKDIEFIRSGEDDPGENDGFWRKLFSQIFKTTSKEKQIQNIQKKTKINMPFCRPDHVLMMYANDLFLNEFQLIIEKCTEIMVSLKDKLPFWYYVVAMFVFPFLIYFTFKLIFKYILNPAVWFRIYSENKSSNPPKGNAQMVDDDPSADRISGENLKQLIALALRNTSNKKLLMEACSGVQELRQSLEANSSPEKKDTPSSSSKESSFESIATDKPEVEAKS